MREIAVFYKGFSDTVNRACAKSLILQGFLTRYEDDRRETGGCGCFGCILYARRIA